jgi:hypothetical protein
MAIVNPGYDWKKHCVVYVTTAILALSLFALSSSFLGQPSVETVKHRDLTIDLGDGFNTNAQLTIPAIGENS